MSERTIEFRGKTITVTDVQPGVVQKSDSIFYVQDCVTKEWLYCNPQRLNKLNEKHRGDLSAYCGRASKAAQRAAPTAPSA